MRYADSIQLSKISDSLTTRGSILVSFTWEHTSQNRGTHAGWGAVKHSHGSTIASVTRSQGTADHASGCANVVAAFSPVRRLAISINVQPTRLRLGGLHRVSDFELIVH